jgi:CheY-like chemotaxis protein
MSNDFLGNSGGDSPFSSNGSGHLSSVLDGKNILVVEDEALVAAELNLDLLDHGAQVVGPVGTLSETLSLLERTNDISAAILDVRLSDAEVYPAVDILVERNVPVVFHTGHAAAGEIQKRFPDAKVCLKPQRTMELVSLVAGMLIT